MRPALVIVHAVALAVLLPVGLPAQEKPAPLPAAPTRKGDRIAIYGCLRGSSLEATDLGGGSDDVSPVTQGLTFRLTGDKKLLKEMKEKHEKRLVEVQGVLKSDLQPSAPEAKVGRVRIGIGTPPTGSMAAADEAKRSVPVVEVTSYTGRDMTCGR
jgi:hypothetical protein